MTIYTATKTPNGWAIQHPVFPNKKEVHASLPVAISEMKRATGNDTILIEV